MTPGEALFRHTYYSRTGATWLVGLTGHQRWIWEKRAEQELRERPRSALSDTIRARLLVALAKPRPSDAGAIRGGRKLFKKNGMELILA